MLHGKFAARRISVSSCAPLGFRGTSAPLRTVVAGSSGKMVYSRRMLPPSSRLDFVQLPDGTINTTITGIRSVGAAKESMVASNSAHCDWIAHYQLCN